MKLKVKRSHSDSHLQNTDNEVSDAMEISENALDSPVDDFNLPDYNESLSDTSCELNNDESITNDEYDDIENNEDFLFNENLLVESDEENIPEPVSSLLVIF